MKRPELSRELKADIWRQFEAGKGASEIAAQFKVPVAAVEKQHSKWFGKRRRANA